MINHRFSLMVAGAWMCFAGFTVQAQTRIMPLGDSVTSSFTPHDSYRYWLWHELVDAGFSVDFIGSQSGVANGPPTHTDFDMNHEGHPGWTTSDAAGNIGGIAAQNPDIVLLDLGSNDVQQGMAFDDIATNLVNIIEGFRAVNPNVIVLLAIPTRFIGQDKQGMSRLRRVLAWVAKNENQPNSRVMIVNIAGGFNARKDTFDGVHPDESGEQKIAKRLFAALRKLLL